MSDPVSAADAIEAAGVTQRQGYHWIARGWIRSEDRKGWVHVLSPYEAGVLRIMADLARAGLPPSQWTSRKAREIADAGPGVPVCFGAVWLTWDPDGQED